MEFGRNNIGDHQFDNIFREYYKSLRAFAFRYVNDLYVAEDIVQDVFIQLLHKHQDLGQIQSIRSYLFSAVFNAASNYLKHKRIEEKFQGKQLNVFAELEMYLHQQTNDVHNNIFLHELEHQITEAVDSMPEQCRKIFVLSRMNGLKNHEIATKLGITIKAVEKQITKALMILREKLKDYLTILLFFI